MGKTAQDVLNTIKSEGIELIDLKFTDLHGKWQHLTVCSDLVDEDAFRDGLAFDGETLDVKYHNIIASRRLNSQWIGM